MDQKLVTKDHPDCTNLIIQLSCTNISNNCIFLTYGKVDLALLKVFRNHQN